MYTFVIGWKHFLSLQKWSCTHILFHYAGFYTVHLCILVIFHILFKTDALLLYIVVLRDNLTPLFILVKYVSTNEKMYWIQLDDTNPVLSSSLTRNHLLIVFLCILCVLRMMWFSRIIISEATVWGAASLFLPIASHKCFYFVYPQWYKQRVKHNGE